MHGEKVKEREKNQYWDIGNEFSDRENFRGAKKDKIMRRKEKSRYLFSLSYLSKKLFLKQPDIKQARLKLFM